MTRHTIMVRGVATAALALTLALASSLSPAAAKPPLRIGFSDWPGWTPMQIAVEKGWFKDAGIDVEMQWFDYSASLDAFAAGKLDGDFLANGDGLGLSANGAKNVAILLTDYSSGNDQIVGKSGVKSVKDLAGKKVGVEVGLVDHLLLERALKTAGMKLTDVTLVNAKTNETPQVLASGSVAAICAWQPVAGEAIKQAPGARPIYTSAQAPGLIYDALAVSPQSLKDRREDWAKVLTVWYRVVDYMKAPASAPDALRIMAARDGVDPKTYAPFVKGTHILSLAEAKAAFKPGNELSSLFGSDKNADDFNVRNGVYKQAQDVAANIDPSLTAER